MTIGEMRDRIEIWEQKRVPNGIGGYAFENVLIATVWGKVTYTDSEVAVEGQKEKEKRSADILIRERFFSMRMFMRFDGYQFKVKEFLPKPDRYLTITAEGEPYGN